MVSIVGPLCFYNVFIFEIHVYNMDSSAHFNINLLQDEKNCMEAHLKRFLAAAVY